MVLNISLLCFEQLTTSNKVNDFLSHLCLLVPFSRPHSLFPKLRCPAISGVSINPSSNGYQILNLKQNDVPDVTVKVVLISLFRRVLFRLHLPKFQR
jgi:hypothetical protein